MSLEKQRVYCESKGLPVIAPHHCFHCKKEVEDNDNELITGCKHCNHSFCD